MVGARSLSLSLSTVWKELHASDGGGGRALRWATAGWIFFVAENAVLSENREFLIDWLGGDEAYHAVYGTVSTAATGSIAYSYYRLTRGGSGAAASAALRVAPVLVSWTAMTAGAIMASQALPKMQIPVALVGGNTNEASSAETPSPTMSSSFRLQVRCPFDFSDQKREAYADDKGTAVRGLDRISRHPGLWSLGFIGLANSAWLFHVGPSGSFPLAVWWLGPAFVAWLGGAHADSRFRRGLGGTLDPVYASQTSNLPGAALLSGRQGNVITAVDKLVREEIKPFNAFAAAVLSTLWTASRIRGAGVGVSAAAIAASRRVSLPPSR